MEETKTIELSNRFFKIITVLIIALVVSYLGSLWYQFSALPQNYPQQISISGEGKAVARPDVAAVTLGMNTQGQKSQDVVARNNEVMNKVIAESKALGVEEKDIQTTLYNLMPVYDYTEMGRVFKGYSLDQQVRLKIRNFDIISAVLDKAASLGATTVGDLQFTVDDIQKVKAEARSNAIVQAKEKAESLARQSGLQLGKLINVYEGDCSGYGGCPIPMGMGGVSSMKESSLAMPQIESGQTEVTSFVTLTYWVR